MREQKQQQQKQKLVFPTESAENEINSLEKQPFAMGVEALIATIDNKVELIKALKLNRKT